ncbi:MAG TPA: hypothetical protein VIX17_03330 [Pyrinomonadaceae bacterium]
MSWSLVKIIAAALSLIVLISGHNASRLSQRTTGCGNAVDGVQLCLASVATNLQLSFTNVGDRDITLNLGIVLANGKMQSPTQVAIKFTDFQGTTRRFKFFDKRYSGIGGRVDDYVVPLRAHSTYTLQLSLDQFWCQDTNEFSIPLLAGDNYLTAEFEGTGANLINGDMQGIKFMNFWRGKVESNTLRLSQ